MAYVGDGMGTSGLHNVLEPAAAGIPIVIGKNYQKFDEAKEMIRLGGMLSVNDPKSLYKVFQKIVNDSELCEAMAQKNLDFINTQKGATEKTLDHFD